MPSKLQSSKWSGGMRFTFADAANLIPPDHFDDCNFEGMSLFVRHPAAFNQRAPDLDELELVIRKVSQERDHGLALSGRGCVYRAKPNRLTAQRPASALPGPELAGVGCDSSLEARALLLKLS